MKKIVSVIIVTYNAGEFITNCLNSLEKQGLSKKEIEIIVVDNNSKDNTKELIKKSFPIVRLIDPKKNLGFAAANNLGVNQAKGEFIVLLNPDTVCHHNLLSELLTSLRSDPKVGAVNPKTLLASADSKRYVQNAGIIIFHDGHGRDRGAVVTCNRKQLYEEENEYYQKETIVPAVCGVCLAIRKTTYLQTGGFDDSFFMYYEDVDLSLKLRNANYTLLYQPKAEITHIHSVSSKEWSPLFQFYTERNRLLILARHFSLKILTIEVIKYSFTLLLPALKAMKHLLRGRADVALTLFSQTRLRFKVLASFFKVFPRYFFSRTKITRPITHNFKYSI